MCAELRVQMAELIEGAAVRAASRSVLFPRCSTTFFPGSWLQPPFLETVLFKYFIDDLEREKRQLVVALIYVFIGY